MSRFALIILMHLFSLSALAIATSGYVFHDKNGNGVRDKGEEGIRGVAVSDQFDVVQTNAEGLYQLDAKGYGFVVISVPDGYKANKSYYLTTTGTRSTWDFPLTKITIPLEFRFVHASDTHISEASLNRTQRLKVLADSLKPEFVLVTGDLIKDALRVPESEAASLYEMYVRESKKFTMPVWSAAGNHENFGIERQSSLVSKKNPLYGKKMFHHYLGPNYYSFNFGGIHFIALDDVDFEDLWYYGHVDSVQVEWLKKDLAAVPSAVPVVTFAHMPMFSGGMSLSNFEEEGPGRSLERQKGKLHYRHVVSNAQELLVILQTHPYPISLAGHFHSRQVFNFESTGQKTRFEQAAAVVGNGGEGAIEMRSGITLYTVKAGQISEGKFIPLD
ncbi:metallophosphoesterase [Chryseolinea sp. T2]|uniref:metallophosphoesterase n=1 Tax=Chryseolinea sp. T2 TaxID=3129255 RepID=UPI003076CE41